MDIAVERYNAISHQDDIEQKLEKQRLFKSQVQSYLNLYQFVSQIMPYADTIHEQRYAYLRMLLRSLPKGSKDTRIDISKDVTLQFYRLEKVGEGGIKLNDNDAKDLKGSTDVGTGQTKATDHVSKMITELNDAFGTDFTPADQMFFDQIVEEALSDEAIVQSMNANNLDSFTDYLSGRLIDLFLTRIDSHGEICNTVMMNEEIKSKVAKRLARQLFEQKSS